MARLCLKRLKEFKIQNNMKKIPNSVTKPLVYTEKLAEKQYSCLHPKPTADTFCLLPLALNWDKHCLIFVLQGLSSRIMQENALAVKTV